MAFAVAATAGLWNAPNIANLIAASDDAGHGALNIPAPRFKLDLIERDAVAARSNLFGITTLFKVDIMESAIMRFISDRPATRTNGSTFGLTVGLAVIVPVVASIPVILMAIMPSGGVADGTVTVLANTQMDTAIACMEGYPSCHFRVCFAVVCQSRSSEEQRRRKG